MQISVLLFLRNLDAMKQQMRTLYEASIKKGGDICIYIHKQLEFKLGIDINIFNNEI